jgi:cytochrome c-type biogenesis protein CcmH
MIRAVLAGLRALALACAMVVLASAAGLAPQALAQKEARPAVADPALEKRVLAIAEELRCLVCQNETLAASQADLAVDLRRQIERMLQQGQSQQQIIDYMVARYGDFVLYRPPVGGRTLLLWFGPFVLLAGGVAGLVLHIRSRRRTVTAESQWTPEQARRARSLLDDKDNP